MEPKVTRAKFKLEKVTLHEGGTKEYKFYAVTDESTPENKRFHKYSPEGDLTIMVDNPEVEFNLGQYYYLDFILATE